jgi:hypothetical protein
VSNVRAIEKKRNLFALRAQPYLRRHEVQHTCNH